MSTVPIKHRDRIECATAFNPAVDPEGLAERLGVPVAVVYRVWREMDRINATPDNPNNPTPDPEDDTYDEVLVARMVKGTATSTREPERAEACRRLATQGLSDREIARHVGMNGYTLRVLRAKYGLPKAAVTAPGDRLGDRRVGYCPSCDRNYADLPAHRRRNHKQAAA